MINRITSPARTSQVETVGAHCSASLRKIIPRASGARRKESNITQDDVDGHHEVVGEITIGE